MHVVVSGGSGFIGKAVINALQLKDHTGETFDRVNRLDITNLTDVQKIDADAVIHLSGVLGTSELFDNPRLAVDINVQGTLNILEQCRKRGMRYVGITMPTAFPSIYSATKHCAMDLATAFHHAYDLPVSHVRAFNAFGPGQKHGPGHPRKIIPALSTEAWQNKPMTIWGDGTNTVDLIYVADLAKMLVEALAFGNNEIFDGGTGQPHTVNQVATMIAEITGSTAGTVHLPMRKGEIATQIRAKGDGWDKLAWRPEFLATDFAVTVKSYQ